MIVKGCDSFGPIGPWRATRDEIADAQDLHMYLDVNEERTRRGKTRTMIFGCAEIVSTIGRFMTLLPGDVMRLSIEGFGLQEQEVQAASWPRG